MHAILGVSAKMRAQRRGANAMMDSFRNWRRKNSDLFIVLCGIAFYLLQGLGLYFGWLRPRVHWLYIILITLPGVSMLISIIKLGWIDRLLGTNWAARWWAWEGRCDLKLGRHAEAAWCRRKAQQLIKAPLEPFRPFAKVVCALRITRLLTQVGALLSMAGASQSKGKRFAFWCLTYTAALCRQAGNLHEEMEALSYVELVPHVSPPLLYQMELRRHLLKKLLELEEVKKIVLEVRKILQTPKAARSLERLLHSLWRLPARNRKSELLILTALSYVYERRSDPIAWGYAQQAGQVLKEILYVEPSPFIAGQRILIAPSQLAMLTRPLESLAGSLPDEFSWVLWLLLAIYYADERQFEGARSYCEKAIQCVEKARILRTYDEERVRFMVDKTLAYDFMLKLIIQTGRGLSQMKDQILKAFEYTERAKARAFLDLIELGEEKSRGGLPTAAAPVRGVQEIQQALLSDSALIEYYLSEDLLLIFVITNDTFDLTQVGKSEVKGLLGMLDQFERHMSGFLQGHNSTKAIIEITTALYNYLLQPIKLDWGKLKRLFIVPHGRLYGLPFCALFDASRGRFLIERLAITQVPSASIWYYLSLKREARSRTYSYFGVANPRPRGDDQCHFAWQLDPSLRQDIVGCEEVVKSTAKLFDSAFDKTRCGEDKEYHSNNVCILLREKATYALFKEYLKDYTIVDLETHAYYDPGKPMRSAFALVGEEGEPRWITAEEVLDFHLHPEFQLLVLAICYGGEVQVTPSNDLLGLIRAFMAIGAHSILSYRWPLLDEPPTVELLKVFYESWTKAAKPKDQALQDAQKKLIEQGHQGERPRDEEGRLRSDMPTLDHPYYWAWTLIGDHL